MELIQFWGISLQGQGHSKVTKIEKSLSLSIGQILIAYYSTIDIDIITKRDGPKDMDTLSDTHEIHSDWSNQSTVTDLSISSICPIL